MSLTLQGHENECTQIDIRHQVHYDYRRTTTAGEGSIDPGSDDDHHAHHQDARTQPRVDHRGCLEILCPLRKTSAFADKKQGKRLKGYKKPFYAKAASTK